MKRLLAVLFVFISVIIAAPYARAQMGFITGLAVGSVLFGDEKQFSGSGVIVLYTAPRVAERIKDPLNVRMGNVGYRFGGEGAHKSVSELFGDVLSNKNQDRNHVKKLDPTHYEVLQVLLMPDIQNKNYGTVWFFYIEKNQVIPLEQLPAQKAQKK